MRYEIRIKGHLNPDWSDWLEGWSITHAAGGVTILSGMIVDQAALYGIVVKLRDLGVQLLSVHDSASTAQDNNHQS